MENPFMSSHVVSVNNNEKTYFFDGTEQENARKAEAYMKKIKEDHPDAKIYGSVKFGEFNYRVMY